MDELFKETNKFLIEFQDNLQIELTEYYQARHDGGYSEYSNEEDIEYDLWHKENKYYPFIAEWEYHRIINEELKELNDRDVYFLYCKFRTYEKTYKDRLNQFLETHEDAEPIYFLKNELESFSKPIGHNIPFQRLNEESKIKLSYTREKTVKFLIKQALKINYNVFTPPNIEIDIFSFTVEEIENENREINNIVLKWNGDKSNLIEVIEALIVNKNIQGTKKEIYETFGILFNEDLSNNAITVSKFINRSEANETKFLNELKSSLLDDINKKFNKNRR